MRPTLITALFALLASTAQAAVPGAAVRTGVPGSALRTTGVPGSALARPRPPAGPTTAVTSGASLGHLQAGDLTFLGIDRNGDGKLSPAEFRISGLSEAQFAAVDGNHDSTVSRQEFTAFGPLKKP